MREIALVATGGAVGASMRYIVNVMFASRGWTGFPWHTLLVNLLGAFLLGLLAAVSVERGLIDTRWLLFLGTGVLGGFTTFSALSYETVLLVENGDALPALLNAVGSVVAGVVMAWVGLLAGRSL